MTRSTVTCGVLPTGSFKARRATYYGIGAAIARIVGAILHDQRSILTVTAPTPEVAGVTNVTLALPRLVGGNGVVETFPLPLSEGENRLLRKSAEVIRGAIDDLEQAT